VRRVEVRPKRGRARNELTRFRFDAVLYVGGEAAGQPSLGGYQLMVSADIFRGRYRESFETAKAIAADRPLPYRFALPTANHVFLPGHKIMVQVQSSWFPLYDRNPQTFVPSIFRATPADYRKATQRIYHAPGRVSSCRSLVPDDTMKNAETAELAKNDGRR
jgi:predicted acyl esterase